MKERVERGGVIRGLTSVVICGLFLLSINSVQAQSQPQQRAGYPQQGNSQQQQRQQQQQDEFQPYWFAGAGVGPRVYFGDHNRRMEVSDRFSFGGDLFFGRQWSPVIGSRLGYSFQSINGATQNGSFATSTSSYYIPVHRLYKQEYNVGNLYADLLVDASNWWGGYRPDRFYSFVPFTGVGFAHAYDEPKTTSWSLSIGILNRFRLSNNFDLVLDARGALVSDKFDHEPGERKGEGILSINLGIICSFGK